MKNKPWTSEEVDFIKKYYPNNGGQYCAKYLNRDVQSLMKKANRLNLKVSPDVKLINKKITQLKIQNNRPNSDFKVNVEQFIHIDKPEVAYILGFLWADGYIIRNEIRLEIVKNDMNTIKMILECIGIWTYSERQRNNWQPISRATTSNKRLVDFLKENDYNKKSYISPDKIISKIPEHLRHYFFRGIVDGDGNIDKDKKRFTISSSYSQDWGYLERLCTELNINYGLYRKKNNNGHSSSVIELYSDASKKFGDYIYNDMENDKIGLYRKYNKFIELNDKIINTKRYQLNIKKEIARDLYHKGIPVSVIITETGIPSTTLRRFLKSILKL